MLLTSHLPPWHWAYQNSQARVKCKSLVISFLHIPSSLVVEFLHKALLQKPMFIVVTSYREDHSTPHFWHPTQPSSPILCLQSVVEILDDGYFGQRIDTVTPTTAHLPA